MIPCKDCLILPVCRNKEILKCSVLAKWMNQGVFSSKEAEECFPRFMFFAVATTVHSDEVRVKRRPNK